ncbi:MAG: hypothetical protein ACJASX_003504 [Limisphaerales bacterium]|jgi:hypothetical protein
MAVNTSGPVPPVFDVTQPDQETKQRRTDRIARVDFMKFKMSVIFGLFENGTRG